MVISGAVKAVLAPPKAIRAAFGSTLLRGPEETKNA